MATRDEVYIDIITEIKKSVTNLAKLTAGIGAAYMAAKKLISGLKEAFKMAEYAAQVNQVQAAFRNMAESVGEDAEKIVQDLKRMSLGTVDQLNLIKGASRAALFDIPLDKLDELMKISMASATATGESVQYMFDSIVTGIGRASPLILDNLGLQLKVGVATEAYAQSLGKSAEQLTMTERKQAILNAVLAAGGDIMAKVGKVAHELTDAQRVEQYKAAMMDLRGEIGKFMLPAFRAVTETATTFVTKLREAVELRNIMRDVSQGTAKAADELKLVNAQLEEYARRNKAAQEFGPVVTDEEIEALNRRRVALQQQIYWEEQEKKIRSDAAKKAAELARQEAARAEQLQEYLKIVREAYGKTEAGQKEALEGQIKYWEEALKTADKTAPQIKVILQELYDKYGEMNGRLNSAIETTGEFVDEIVTGFPAVSKEVLGLTGLMHDFVDSLTDEGRLQAAIDEYERLRDMPALPSYEAIRHAEEYAGGIRHITNEVKTLTEEQQKMADAATTAFTAFGEAFAETAIEGGKIFKEAIKAAMAAVLTMLGKEAMVRAGIALALGRVGMAAALAGVGTLAFTSAAAVRAMAEGGIVTKPTVALIGERGPEAVVPLNRGGAAMGNINIFVRGSLITENQLADRVIGRLGRHFRGH